MYNVNMQVLAAPHNFSTNIFANSIKHYIFANSITDIFANSIKHYIFANSIRHIFANSIKHYTFANVFVAPSLVLGISGALRPHGKLQV